MTGYTLRLFAWSLGSRHGFNDGDIPESLLDWCDQEAVGYPTDWRSTLCLLVRKHLLPVLPIPVAVYEIDTSHNPIRAVDPELVADLTEYVEVTWEQINQAAAPNLPL